MNGSNTLPGENPCADDVDYQPGDNCVCPMTSSGMLHTRDARRMLTFENWCGTVRANSTMKQNLYVDTRSGDPGIVGSPLVDGGQTHGVNHGLAVTNTRSKHTTTPGRKARTKYFSLVLGWAISLRIKLLSKRVLTFRSRELK